MKSRWSKIIIALVIIIILMLGGWWFYKTKISPTGQNEVAVDKQIEQGNLSNHPASFYKEVGP